MDGIDVDCLSKERKAQAEAVLNKKLKCRPNRVDLEMQNILKHSYPPNVNPEFASRRESLERQLIHNRLNKQLEYRPGTLEVINRGYLIVDNHVDVLVRQGMVPFQTVEEVSEEENYSAPLSLASCQAWNDVANSSENDSIILPTSFSDTVSSSGTYPSIKADTYNKCVPSVFCGVSEPAPSTPQFARSRSSSINGGNCPPTVAKMSQVTRFGPLTFHTFNPRGTTTSHKQQVREQQQKDLLNLELHATLKHNLLDELKNATNTTSLSQERVSISTNSPVSTVSATTSSTSVGKKMLPVMSLKLDSFNVSTLLSFCRYLGIRPNTRRKQNIISLLTPHTDKLRQFLINNSPIPCTNKGNLEDISNVSTLPVTNPSPLSTSSPHLFSPEGLPVLVDQSPLTLSSCIPPTHSVEGHFRHSLSTPQFFQNMDVNGSVQRTTSFSSHPYDDSSMSSEFNSVLSKYPLLVSQRSPPNACTVPNYFSPLPSTVTSTPINSVGPSYNVGHISSVQHLPYNPMPIHPRCFPNRGNVSVTSTFSQNGDSCHSMSMSVLNSGTSCIIASKPPEENQSRLDEMLKSITEFTRLRDELQAKKRHSSSSDLGYDNELQQHLQQVECQLQLHMQEASQIMQSMKLASPDLQSLVSTTSESNHNQMSDDAAADALDNFLLDEIFKDFPVAEVPTSVSSTNVQLQETCDVNVDNQLYSFTPVSSTSMNQSSIFINSTSHPVRLGLDGVPFNCDKFSLPDTPFSPIDGKNVNCNVGILPTETNDPLASIFLHSPMQTTNLIEENSSTDWLPSNTLDDVLLGSEFVTEDVSWDDFMSTEPFTASIR